ncbi:hypothetical protein WN51_00217 [Melipona quadrifasciata]|uniref:Dipeptidase n=1 Tax=Melipona quadrifasciata TaxID=166423 RepID=A0A0M9AE58_9HYME|nr:hypothetical protein WN51_00217 [Melipona quadrifasciata]
MKGHKYVCDSALSEKCTKKFVVLGAGGNSNRSQDIDTNRQRQIADFHLLRISVNIDVITVFKPCWQKCQSKKLKVKSISSLVMFEGKRYKNSVKNGVREQPAKPPSALKDSFCPVMKQIVDRTALDRGARMFSRTENPEVGVYVMSHQCREYPGPPRSTTCLTELPDVAPCNGTVRLPPPCEDSPSSGSSKDRREESPRRRCRVLAPILLLVAALLLGGLCLPLLLQSAPVTHQQRLDVIRRILTEVPLIDGHNDLPWNVRKFVHNQLGEVNLSSDLGRVDPWARSDWSHTDIPRLRAGLVGAQVSVK